MNDATSDEMRAMSQPKCLICERPLIDLKGRVTACGRGLCPALAAELIAERQRHSFLLTEEEITQIEAKADEYEKDLVARLSKDPS